MPPMIKKEKSYEKVWTYDLAAIAGATGQTQESVRDQKQSGKLVPGDFVRVCEYVVGKRLVNGRG